MRLLLLQRMWSNRTMSYTDRTIKRLFISAHNECAMPCCSAPLLIEDIVVGEICHIHARSKKGPRYRPDFSLKDRDDFPNLLLLCKTCHTLVDSHEGSYPPDKLRQIKDDHERQGFRELTPTMKKQIEILAVFMKPKKRVSARSGDHGASVAVGRDNHGPITINQTTNHPRKASKYPPNSIGADANLAGYIDYLFAKAIDYWKPVRDMNPGRLGRKIKMRFKLGVRTRNHLSVDRFEELVNFIIEELLAKSPVGKKHTREGKKFVSSFSEWRNS